MKPLRLVPSPTVARDGELPTDVLRRAGSGDAAALRAFVQCYERRVYSLCVRIVLDVHAAEDAAQETFLKAFGALPRFDVHGPARCSTWLLTIATHHCLDELRRRKRRPIVDELALAQLVADVDTAQSANDRAARRVAEQALAQLSDEHRAVVVLRVLADESVDDTAAILGVAAGTVKSRLARAKEALKDILQGALS
jgi:RNA polymerase sigma-70 factor (ECF subfamily)